LLDHQNNYAGSSYMINAAKVLTLI